MFRWAQWNHKGSRSIRSRGAVIRSDNRSREWRAARLRYELRNAASLWEPEETRNRLSTRTSRRNATLQTPSH